MRKKKAWMDIYLIAVQSTITRKYTDCHILFQVAFSAGLILLQNLVLAKVFKYMLLKIMQNCIIWLLWTQELISIKIWSKIKNRDKTKMDLLFLQKSLAH